MKTAILLCATSSAVFEVLLHEKELYYEVGSVVKVHLINVIPQV